MSIRNTTETRCPFCSGLKVILKGRRKTKNGPVQKYYCRKCARFFTLTPLPGYTHPPGAVINAAVLYYQGKSLHKVKKLVSSRYKINPSVSTVYFWIKEFGKYSGLKDSRREIVSFAKKNKIILKKVYKHNQNYKFKMNNYKFNFLDIPPNIKQYLSCLLSDKIVINTAYFSKRASSLNLDLKTTPEASGSDYKQYMAGIALKMAKSNTLRHELLQRFFLNIDKTTLACEVPVYLNKTESREIMGIEGGILGHIDFLQVSGQTVIIADYKPDARKEKNVQSQLFIYAVAFSKRANVHLKHIICSWFDENDSYSIDAMKLYKAFRQNKKRAGFKNTDKTPLKIAKE